VNGGPAVRFDVLWQRETHCAFVLRFRGVVHGYLNRCAHVPMEMDWQPGQFFDSSQRWILCATHGAAYEPDTGLCIAGPCNGARLIKLDIEEADGAVSWYPTDSLQPVV
jgi:nitrite reductase/ring-hydroxylating ferredoxin subunit